MPVVMSPKNETGAQSRPYTASLTRFGVSVERHVALNELRLQRRAQRRVERVAVRVLRAVVREVREPRFDAVQRVRVRIELLVVVDAAQAGLCAAVGRDARGAEV